MDWFIEEIVDGLYRIPTIVLNIYIIEKSESLILIDTGFRHNPKKVLESLKNIQSSTGKKLSSILISHFHIDHAAGLWKIEKLYSYIQILCTQ